METLLDAPVRGVRRLRPRTRSVGVAQVVAATALLAVLTRASFEGCAASAADPIPGALGLAGLVAVAAVAMIGRIPRTSSVAPALSLGAAVVLLGGAMVGWGWVSSQQCVDNGLDAEVVTLLIATAASVAVAGTSLWLLADRREIEPWFGSLGVAVSATAAVSLIFIALIVSMLLQPGAGSVHTVVVVLPWALVVAATGWLRRSPAIAVVTPAACQALWLLFT